MLAITSIETGRFATAVRSLLALPVRWVSALKREQAKRTLYRQMLLMDAHLLRDVGLTRDAVEAALSQPPVWDNY